VSEPRGVAQPG